MFIIALATYRLTLLINKEAGPFDIFGKFRTWAGIRFDQYSVPYATGQLSEAIICPYCLSVWVGICVTLLTAGASYLGFLTLITFLLLPLALSGFTVFLFRYAGV